MKAQIIYVKGHEGSELQAQRSLDSFKKHNWDAELYEGITPASLVESDFPYPDMIGSRMMDFRSQVTPHNIKYFVKKSCVFNNLKFAERVVKADEPMAFIEHDAICISPMSEDWDFDEFLFYSYEYAFSEPGTLAKAPFNKYPLTGNKGVNDFPVDYPLRYKHNSLYHGAIQTPGTAAYALTPKGAKKLLHAAKTHGIEQSDYIINSYNLRLQYVWSSPVKYNEINLNLSHKLDQ